MNCSQSARVDISARCQFSEGYHELQNQNLIFNIVAMSRCEIGSHRNVF